MNQSRHVKKYEDVPRDPGRIVTRLNYGNYTQLAMETPPDDRGGVASGLFNNPGIRVCSGNGRDVNVPYLYYYPPSQIMDSLLWEGAVVYD